MPSLRVAKVNELIKREAAASIVRELEVPKMSMATITRVEAEADLKTARVYLRTFPEQNTKIVLEYIRKRAGIIQRALNKKLHMQHVPQLSFYVDKEKDAEGNDDRTDAEKILDSLSKE